MQVTQFLPALCRVRVIKQDKMLTLKRRKYKSKLVSLIFPSAGKQFLARISHQFRWRQVQSFWQLTIVVYVYCQNTAEDGATWADLW